LFARPPLVIQVIEPLDFKLVIVHLRSARGLGDQVWVAEKRRHQAQRLVAWIKAQEEAVVLAGDFNSGPGNKLFSQPWHLIQAAGLYNSALRLESDDRYSYRHRCRPESLDHILLSPALVGKLRAVAISRGNAGRYKVLYGSRGTKVV